MSGALSSSQIWDLQSDPEENPCHSAVTSHRGVGQLRSDPERVLLRPTPGSVCANIELLPVRVFLRDGKFTWVIYWDCPSPPPPVQDRQTALPDRCVRTAVWRGARVLGPRLEPSRAVLLVNVQHTQGHPGLLAGDYQRVHCCKCGSDRRWAAVGLWCSFNYARQPLESASRPSIVVLITVPTAPRRLFAGPPLLMVINWIYAPLFLPVDRLL